MAAADATAAAAPAEEAAPAAGDDMDMGEAEAVLLPMSTLYVNNLNEKVKKEQLKKALLSVFAQFGKILDIVASRATKLRGQAWVVFEDTASATNAMRQMQGFPFYDKPLKIAYAKEKSDLVAKKDGSYVAREKRARDFQGPAAEGAPAPTKAARRAAPAKAKAAPKANAVPHSILFAQDLPTECELPMLQMLFQPYVGYKEVRLVPGKAGLAFIEFDSEMQASLALEGLSGFSLTPTDTLQLSYAKR